MTSTTDKPLAIVTGASSGVGLELARQFAEHGYDLVITAADEELDATAQQLRAAGAQVDAGVGTGGAFVGETEVDLNVRSTVHLAYRLLPPMVRRGDGRVLFTSSIAATSPGPFMAAYNAAKAFVKSFAEALREELRDIGVTVTTLMPGPTDTEFFDRADMRDTKVGAGRHCRRSEPGTADTGAS